MSESGDAAAKPAREVLFAEQGASWVWVLAGPVAGLAMLLIQISTGYGPRLFVPGVFLVLVSGFIAVQVKAARIHTSVELTRETLRQGAETINVSDIMGIYPGPENTLKSGRELTKWQSARAIGELTGVPRGRTGIGLKLSQHRTAQAWARRHRELRAALTALVEQRSTSSDADAAP